jgi:mannose-6-phosphate isomerase-like protein (cupin superfamily)
MVVRDAADLLDVVFRHHLREGVERFLVFDHGSVDGTRPLLGRWAETGLVEWAPVDGPYRAERWINDLAFAARLRGADWLLPIDADELWTAGARSLVEVLGDAQADVLEARVVNFVQERGQLRNEPGALLRMCYRVDPPVPLDGGVEGFLAGTLPFVALACPVKCISRGRPGLWIRRGNHDVTPALRREYRGDVFCLHAPLRSLESLAQRRRPEGFLDPTHLPGDSWHWRKWLSLAEESELEAEWVANSVEAGRLGCGSFPVVVDRRLSSLALRASQARSTDGAPRASRPAAAAGDRPNGSALSLAELRLELDRRADEEEAAAARLAREIARRDGEIARRDAEIARRDCEAARRDREIERLGGELAAARREHGRVAAEVAARLAVLDAIERSRAHRLWMASIRFRRAMRRAWDRWLPHASAVSSRRLRRRFEALGVLDPVRVLEPWECERLLAKLREEPPRGVDWGKDLAATSRSMYEIAVHPRIGEVLGALLGEEVMLWGASIVARGPGDVHPWHTDIESSAPDGRTVSVWLGLENVSEDSALLFVERSHRFGETLQEVASEHGRRRGESADTDVAEWARRRDPRSRITRPAPGEGEALFFDGRLWHASRNTSGLARTALLLQYATPGTPIRILDASRLEWPFRFLEEPWPRCLRLRGSYRIDPRPSNRFVAPPPAEPAELPAMGAVSRRLRLPLAGASPTGWHVRPIFAGSTPNLANVSCHVSMLDPGCSPHPPHHHREEELLVVLDGAAEVVLVDDSGRETAHSVSPGWLSYYPAHTLHTLWTRDVGATYLVLRWVGRGDRAADTLAPSVLPFETALSTARSSATAAPGGFAAATVFEGPTRDLALLHAHCSAVAPGGGYEAHTDPHDVVLVLLSGAIETAGASVRGSGVVMIPAGVPHGLRNPGAEPASYLALELHRAPPARD